MVAHQDILLEFVERLYGSNDIDTLFSALEHATLQLGFEHVSYTYVPELLNRLLTDVSPVFQISANYRVDFIDQYQACNFGQHDFAIKKITQGELEPVNWWETARERQLSDKEKRVIEVARDDYGLRHGVTIPVLSDGGNIAGVSATSSEPDHLFELLYHERIKSLTLISRMYNDRILQLPQHRTLFFQSFLRRLSATEKSVLVMLSQGFNLKSIASELQLEYKYLANNVVPSLRKKFGDIPRDQLMFQAGRIEFDKLIV